MGLEHYMMTGRRLSEVLAATERPDLNALMDKYRDAFWDVVHVALRKGIAEAGLMWVLANGYTERGYLWD